MSTNSKAGPILGIDPGLNTTGYAVLQSANARLRVLEAGVIRSSPKLPPGPPPPTKTPPPPPPPAPKRQTQRATQTELGLDSPPEPHDVADALAVALCHYYAAQQSRQRDSANRARSPRRTARPIQHLQTPTVEKSEVRP